MRLRNLARNASFVAAGSLAAAGVALLLRSAIAYQYGATAGTDALLAALQTGEAFTVPFVWILSTTFIPTFAIAAVRDRDQAWLVARTVFLLACVVFGALGLFVSWFAPQLASLVVGGSSQEVVALTGRMVPIFAAGSVLAGLGGLLVGVLQAQGNFSFPALVLPTRSVVAIIAVLALGARFGIWAAAFGVLAGYALQTTLLASRTIPRMFDKRTIDCQHPAVLEIGRLMIPMVAGTFLFQVNQLISVRFASGVEPGAITQLNYALGLVAVTAGLVGQSTIEAAFPSISRSAGLDDGGTALRRDVTLLLRISVFLGSVAAAALVAGASGLAWVLFGHGTFAGAAVERTGQLVAVYGVGLPGLILTTVLPRVFYAMRNTLTPQVLIVAAIALNTGLAWRLVEPYGVLGVAIASVVAYGLYSASLLLVLGIAHRLVEWRTVGSALGRGLVMAGVVWLAMRTVGTWFPPPALGTPFLVQLLRLFSMGGAGAVVGVTFAFTFNELGARSWLARKST